MFYLLTGKTIHVIATGATESIKGVGIFLNLLKKENAECIFIPTPMCRTIIDWEFVNDFEVADEYNRYENNHFDSRITEADIVVVAPCTFNSLSKIANGIADNYPMTLLQEAIGSGKDVFIVPSMKSSCLFDHPITKKNIRILSSFRNVTIIKPEYVYSNDGILKDIKMAPWQKIVDCVSEKYIDIKFSEAKIEFNTNSIIESNFYSDFFTVGKELQENHYSSENNGFIAKRISDGVLITSLGADIGDLERDNLTFIHSWKDDKLIWSGNLPPSSESLLAIRIFDKFPNTNAIVHSHCNDITNKSKMVKYLTDEYVGHCDWGDVTKIIKILDKYNKCIIRMHGEIIISDTTEKALFAYSEMYKEAR